MSIIRAFGWRPQTEHDAQPEDVEAHQISAEVSASKSIFGGLPPVFESGSAVQHSQRDDGGAAPLRSPERLRDIVVAPDLQRSRTWVCIWLRTA